MPKKKILGLLVLAVLLMACANCGGGSNMNSSNAANTNSARADAPPAASPDDDNTNGATDANVNTGATVSAFPPPPPPLPPSPKGGYNGNNRNNGGNTNNGINLNNRGGPNANGNRSSGNTNVAAVENSVDAFLASLPTGEAAFNTPERMRLGETANIELKLGGPQLAGNLSGTISEPGRVETHAVKIGAVMEAQLAGANFQVTPLGPAEQPVAAGEPTEWEWQIKPTAEGRQQLNLTLSVVVAVDGRERRRTHKLFQRNIAVEVDRGTRIGQIAYENLNWIVPAVVLPLAGAVVLRLRKLRKRDGETPPPAG